MKQLLLGTSLDPSGHLVWTQSQAVMALVIGVALLSWLLAWFFSRQVAVTGQRLRWSALVLWAAALVTLGAGVCGPSWVEEQGRRDEGQLVVLVDGSASMGVLEGPAARGAVIDELLGEIDPDAVVFTFDDDLHAGVPDTSSADAWQGRGTDVGLALSVVGDRFLGQQLRGVVLITDGLDRGILRRDLMAAADAGQPLSGGVPDLPGPLTIYQVGQASELYDVAIDDVVSGGFAFLRTPFSLTARVRGPAGKTLPVSLSREGSQLGSKDLTLDDQGLGQVRFDVRPKKVGRFAYTLSVPIEDADAVPGNNSFSVVTRVVRDRTRVLQVSGSPSYDQKFLRLFLKEDPSVDLVSFFILRTREDMGAGWGSDELSLIAFPYERLFTEDLDSFDLVILQNFDYKPYFEWSADELLSNLAAYVRDGGALVMTGGDRSFDLGEYAGTPLADVLPVRLGVTGERIDVTPTRPELTAAGRVHPVTRLGASPEENEASWSRLPELDGYNRVVGLAPDSAALLQHTSVSGSGQADPILAVREVGKGRTMALMSDASWRWSFSEAAVGRGNQAYLRFWKNSLRWLMGDPEDQRIVVTPARENVLLGDSVRIIVKVHDAGYLPLPGVVVKGVVTPPSGRAQPFEATTDDGGEAFIEVQATEQGAHRVVATSPGLPGRGETVFAVSDRDPELVEIVPDSLFLRRLASAYGDRAVYHPAGEVVAPELDLDAGREVIDRRVVNLATVPLIGLLFGLLSGAAWILGRRAGAR